MPVVNYQQQVLNPVQSAMEGYSRGVGIVNKHRESQATQGLLAAQQQEAELRTQKLQQEQEAAAATQKQLGDLGQKVADGTWTAEDFLSLQTSNPAIAEHLSKAFEGVSDVKKKTVVRNMQKLAIALETNPEEAKQIMEEEAQAIENSGGDPSAMRANIKAIDIMPDAVKTSVLATLAAGMPNDEFDNFTQTLNPPKEKPQTDFGKLAADVEAGLVSAEDANAIRESRIKELQQKYNLTDVQMQQALAATEKTKAETSKLLREADAPIEGGRYLTPEEKEAAGYLPGAVVQRDAKGQDRLIQKPGSQTMAESERKFGLYANQALRGQKALLDMEAGGYNRVAAGELATGLISDEAKQYDAAMSQFIEGWARVATGAAITKDETKMYEKMLAPKMGDNEAVRKSKAAVRNQMAIDIREASGRGTPLSDSAFEAFSAAVAKSKSEEPESDGLPAGFVKVQ